MNTMFLSLATTFRARAVSLLQIRQFHVSFDPSGSRISSLSSEDRATILRMYKEHKNIRVITDHVGCASYAVNNYIRKARALGLLDEKRRYLVPNSVFTVADRELLRDAVDQGKSWEECKLLFPTRSCTELRKLYSRRPSSSKPARSPWSDEEDRALLDLRDNQRLQWTEIAELMPQRTYRAIVSRYDRVRPGSSLRLPPVGRPGRPWLGSEVADLRRQLAAGASCADIAQSMGRSYQSVRRKIDRLKADISTSPLSETYPWPPEVTAKLLAMKSSGTSLTQIANALGKSLASIEGKLRWERQSAVNRPISPDPKPEVPDKAESSNADSQQPQIFYTQ